MINYSGLQELMGDYQPGTVERLQDAILRLADEKRQLQEEVARVHRDWRGAVEALRVADNLLRQFGISAHDHSELIRREFGKAQKQINDVLEGR